MSSIKIKATNSYGTTLQLTQQAAYAVASVSGLTPPEGAVYTSELATKDGSFYSASRSQNREIVLDIYPQEKIETARLALYTVFKLAKWVQLELQTGSRHVTIEGWVQSMQGDLYENPQHLQISVLCPDPYFEDYTTTTTALTTAGTAVTVSNAGDEEAGAVFTLTASGSVSDPTIYNNTTGQSFGLDLDLVSGDVVTIDTRRGSLRATLNHSGTITNVINAMTNGSEWVKLQPGSNEVRYNASSGGAALVCSVAFTPIYEGL